VADIFISQSGKNSEVAAAIGEPIRRDRPSWSMFFDMNDIRAGQRWLREELTSCRVVLAPLSRNRLVSPWCFTEAVTATLSKQGCGQHRGRGRDRERPGAGTTDPARTSTRPPG